MTLRGLSAPPPPPAVPVAERVPATVSAAGSTTATGSACAGRSVTASVAIDIDIIRQLGRLTFSPSEMTSLVGSAALCGSPGVKTGPQAARSSPKKSSQLRLHAPNAWTQRKWNSYGTLLVAARAVRASVLARAVRKSHGIGTASVLVDMPYACVDHATSGCAREPQMRAGPWPL